MKLTKEHEEKLYLEHQDYISKIVESVLKKNETFRYLKQELEAECALKFVECVRRYEVDPNCKFSTYLYTRMRGAALNLISAEARITEGERDYAEEQMHIGERSYEIDRFEELISEGDLTENQKNILRMRYILGMTHREIGETLRTSHVAVVKSEQRALDSLKYSLDYLSNFA